MHNLTEVTRNDSEDWLQYGQHDTDETDWLIRWGCTSNVPTQRVINKSEAIHRVNNKRGFRHILQEHELCPRTGFNNEDIPDHTFPMLLRPSHHAQGRNFYVCHTREEIEVALNQRALLDGYYISEIINKIAEYRVFFVQSRVCCVAQKTPGNPEDIAWNVARGGRFDNVLWDEWPLKAIRLSREAFLLSGLDFGGVDVMVDNDNNCYVIEINSASSLTSPYRQECFAKCFDWIIDNDTKATIPIIDERGGYLKFIHPAICNKARLV